MEEWKGGRMEEDVLEALLQRTMRGAASFKSFQPNRANTSAFHRVLCVRLAFAVHGSPFAGGLIRGTGQSRRLILNSEFCLLFF